MSDTTIRVGTLLRGFCHGAFGRDSYADKRVEAIGADWIVARESDGGVNFYHGGVEDLAHYTVNCKCGCQEEGESDD